MSGGQQGLFSSVLGFLSREVQDFVSTATGSNTTERIVASTSSHLRTRAKPKREARRSRRERLRVSDQEDGGDEETEWREQQHAFRKSARRVRPPRGTSYSPTPSPQRGTYQNPRRSTSPRRPKKLPSKKAAPRRPRRSPSPPPRPPTPPLDDRASQEDHPNDTDAETPAPAQEGEVEEEPAPQLPLPRALRRRPSMTMPGALFPRSPSMDPEPATAPPPRHVHFPTQPTYFDYEVLMPGPSSSPEHARHPSPSPVPVPAPSRSRAASVSEVAGQHSQEDFASSAGGKEKGKQRATDGLGNEPVSSPTRSILSGSDRGASDAEPGPEYVNTSGEIRVRGKEQELSAVREERRAREKWWETETETTMIREEKTGYEDKIKKLEEEVLRLKEELAKRPATNSADHSFSMPPPPPPPPPLPLVLPRIPTTPAATELSFVDIRAHLRHTSKPVEPPINALPVAKHVGKPTIGVPADKMAEFLKEMKTVRLRKVFNAPADMGRAPPRASSAETSFVAVGIQRPPRPADASANVGEKRKRDMQELEHGQSIKRRLMGPLPRSADSSFRSTNSSFSSQSQSLSRSQSQSQPEAGPSKPTRSYIPVRAWPSSSVDGNDVTPSLTSDGDAEQGPDEPLPRTPPQVPATVVDEPEELEVEPPSPPSPPQPPTKKVTPVPRPPTPPRRSHAPSAQSLFDKRPPRSPLPAPTPQKARPPARRAAGRRKIIPEEDDEEDDPLAIVVLDSPLAIRTRKERRPVVTATSTAGPSRHARKGSASSTQSKAARRRTLDEELRRSDGVTEDDLRTFDIEPHTYTTVGSATGRTRKGFLAHGGGGGIPVFVGVGAATMDLETGDDELEIIGPPSPRPPPRRKRATNLRR